MNFIPGNTKLVELKNIEIIYGLNCRIFGKVENSNPTGSIKDRAVYNMLLNYQKDRELKGATIVEATSGNTGIALAFYAKVFGYKCIIVMPSSMSKQRREMIAKYGAELCLIEGGMKESNNKALQLINDIPNSFIFDQFNQKANYEAHYNTAKELLDANPNIGVVAAGIGTGGTITGIGKYMKQNKPDVKIVGVEPLESPLLTEGKAGPHLIQGIGANFVPSILDKDILDKVIDVPGLDAIEMAKLIREKEGLDVGISSGASLLGLITYIRKYNVTGDCVAIFPDKGDRYSW